jgi:large subunit ribosomal protein L10
MKSIGLFVKETSEKQIKNRLKESNTVFIVKYSKVSGPDLSSLRQSLKGANANLFVIKNSVARRALKDSELAPLISKIEGPCGIIFVKDEPVGASRVLRNFAKEHEQLKLEGGFLQDKILDQKDIEVLASLPSKEVLRAQVVMALNSPIAGLVMTLNGVLRKFVICLDQIRQKNEARPG